MIYDPNESFGSQFEPYENHIKELEYRCQELEGTLIELQEKLDFEYDSYLTFDSTKEKLDEIREIINTALYGKNEDEEELTKCPNCKTLFGETFATLDVCDICGKQICSACSCWYDVGENGHDEMPSYCEKCHQKAIKSGRIKA